MGIRFIRISEQKKGPLKKSNTHIILFIIAIKNTIEVLNYVSDRIQYLIIRLIKYSLLLIYSLGRIPDVTFVM